MRFSAASTLMFLLAAMIPFSSAAETSSSIEPEAPVTSIEEQIYFPTEELVTGPSKREVKLAEAPSNVTIITHEDIIQSGARNLGEVLRKVPGMDVVTITAADTQASARGFATSLTQSDRMAVFLDGRTFYLEFLGGTLWSLLPIPLADIKRVEVIKGPMSSLYGNRAMLGIINIITYDPAETRTLLEGGGGRFFQAEGDFINAGKFADGYRYKVSGTYQRSNEFSDANNDGNTKDLENLSLMSRFSFEPAKIAKLELTGAFTQGTDRIQFGGLSTWEDRRGLLDGRAVFDLGSAGEINVQTYWWRDYISSRTFDVGTQILDTVDSEVRHSISFDVGAHFKNTVTYGFDYRFVDGNNVTVTALHNFAGFLQDEARLFDKVILTGGMRADYQKDFAGTNISAHGSAVFLIHPKYNLRMGFGTAFSTPTLLQYFTSFSAPISFRGFTTAQTVGNPNLKAERILYFEVGNTIEPIEKLTVRADFFYYRINNLISNTVAIADPTTLLVSSANGGGARAIGGEIGVEGRPFDWLSAYASWSYEDFKAIDGNLSSASNLGNPKNKANAGVTGYFFGSRLTANISFDYIRHHQASASALNFATAPVVTVGDVYLLNARVGYWPIKDHLELAVSANNILNDNTPQVPAFDPGLNFVLAENPQFNLWGSLRYVF